MTYTYKARGWQHLTLHQRRWLRREYRYLREGGYPRLSAKALLDRVMLMVVWAGDADL